MSQRVLTVRHLGEVGYEEGLALQDDLVKAVRAGREPDTLLLLEHPHVLTLGTSSEPGHVLVDEDARERLGMTLHRVGRGGDVTYHGPGQLVGYPILDLKPDRKDLHRYLRDLEGALMDALTGFGIVTHTESGYTGVWTEVGKIAAIGVRVSSGWITSHGFALNVAPDLSFFETIVPCGIRDRDVTSMERELGAAPDHARVRAAVAGAVAARFGRTLAEHGSEQ